MEFIKKTFLWVSKNWTLFTLRLLLKLCCSTCTEIHLHLLNYPRVMCSIKQVAKVTKSTLWTLFLLFSYLTLCILCTFEITMESVLSSLIEKAGNTLSIKIVLLEHILQWACPSCMVRYTLFNPCSISVCLQCSYPENVLVYFNINCTDIMMYTICNLSVIVKILNEHQFYLQNIFNDNFRII